MGTREAQRRRIERAKADGHENPTPNQILHYGLMAAAMQNPLVIRGRLTNKLVRMALFDLGPSTHKHKPEHLKYVATHVKESLREHSNDTTEEFNRSIEDPKSNLIHRISKRTDCRLDRQQVREALLELGWRSFRLLGQCVDTQMRTFRDAIRKSVGLGRLEDRRFQQVDLRFRHWAASPFATPRPVRFFERITLRNVGSAPR